MGVARRKALIARQRRWAESAGIAVDADGFVRELDANLRVPLSAAARAAFARGSELHRRATAPPRMHAVYSSAALVANVFEPWTGRDCGPLVAALGWPRQAASLTFEAPFPTGLEGDPPLVDVLLELADGRLAAIESKFCEWLVPRPRNKSGFKSKYFPQGRGIWSEHGLVACQALAEDIQSGAERFKHLHAAQLLKHGLALAVSTTRPAALVYLYFDCRGPASGVHLAELERFQRRVGGELKLHVVTYQQLFARLTAQAECDADYLGYLTARYFGNRGAP